MLRALTSHRLRPQRRASFGSGAGFGKLGLDSFELPFEGSAAMEFHFGSYAHLARGSVLCRHGDTVVHAAVCTSRKPSETKDGFLQLVVDYKTRAHASGIIPSGQNRRERGSDEDVIRSRVVDRSLRPLFPEGFAKEVQLTVTVQACDDAHDPVVAAVNASSAALLRSNLPWNGPVGCVRIGCVDGALVVNPSTLQMRDSSLDLVLSGTASKLLMLEVGASEVPEALMKDAFRLAQSEVARSVAAQRSSATLSSVSQPKGEPIVSAEALRRLVRDVPVEDEEDEPVLGSDSPRALVLSVPAPLLAAVRSRVFAEALELYSVKGGLNRRERGQREGRLRAEAMLWLAQQQELVTWSSAAVQSMAVERVMADAFREAVLGGARADGRGLRELRPVSAQVDVLPLVHGSALFQRGDTHVLCTATLGSRQDAKVTRSAGGDESAYFFLHYEFPAFAVGDVGSASALNRRVVGHGNLAEKALRPVLPSFAAFPYTVRVLAECTSSSGSSSMASACAASLALMDAGVPIKAMVAGVSIGLIAENNVFDAPDSGRHVLLTDILGMEDHYGEMDFKVAGTEAGVTAMQLDVKSPAGIPLAVIEAALDAAREGRLAILERMKTSTAACRPNVLKPSAPRAFVVRCDPERKSNLIGPGGETLKYIEERYSCSVDVQGEGEAYLFGRNVAAVEEAAELVRDLVLDIKVGDEYAAEVCQVKDFGALVKIARCQEALLHYFELSHDRELLKRPVTELLVAGQEMQIKVIAVDVATGQIKVSRKALLDAATSVPDSALLELPQASRASRGELPTFPVTPPRKWNRDFFQKFVASASDVERAMVKEPVLPRSLAPEPARPARPARVPGPKLWSKAAPTAPIVRSKDKGGKGKGKSGDRTHRHDKTQSFVDDVPDSWDISAVRPVDHARRLLDLDDYHHIGAESKAEDHAEEAGDRRSSSRARSSTSGGGADVRDA